MTPREPRIVTFGCRLNTYESEVMRAHAKKAGLDDVIIFNTCAVTAEAERQARQAIRRARRENPSARIVVTGCAAQVNPQAYAAMAEVDQVIGNDLKLKPESWGAQGQDRVRVDDIQTVRETASHLVGGFEGRARAFVQVQNGCDHRCTFCIIPYGRGPSRSAPMGVVADQVRTLVHQGGYKEIVLTGVDITSYGPDLPGAPTLGQMIRRILALVPELHRLRLSSLDPVEIDEDLWRLIAEEPRLMPHLHLSVQAGDDMILKRMKRRHLRADALAVCARARGYRPDMALGADLIAGFPTETEDMFRNTLDLVQEAGIDFLHVFPFSARKGTPAARMPLLERGVVQERAARLRHLGRERMHGFLDKHVSKVQQVVAEKEYVGRTEHFALVRPDRPMTPGDVFRIKAVAREGEALTGQLLAQ